MDPKRILWLDSSRGLAFLMVIYSHIEFCNHFAMKFFAPVFLSIFFFVSGFLAKDDAPFSRYAEQRLRTLYWPFLFYGLLLFCKRHIFSLHSHTGSWGHDLWLFFLQDGRDNFIWFIPALFVFSLVFYPFLKWIKRDSALFWALAAFAAVNYAYKFLLAGPDLPYHLDTCGFACLLMGLGKIYRRRGASLARLFTWKAALPCLAAYCAICYFSPYMSYAGSKIMVDWIAATALGLFLMIYVSGLRPMQCWLMLKIGANTLICFILHGQVYGALEAVAAKVHLAQVLGGSVALTAVVAIAEVFITAVALLVPIWIINRYLPFTIGKGFKLWKA